MSSGSGYTHDIFLSYSRKPPTGEWVKNHFHAELKDCLLNELGVEVPIFIDFEQETGNHWPTRITQALHKSKLLVAVWSPPYFHSEWCMAEWETMRARERMTGYRCPENPKGLVYAVSSWDGKNFPLEAQETQCLDLSDWSIPYDLPPRKRTEVS